VSTGQHYGSLLGPLKWPGPDCGCENKEGEGDGLLRCFGLDLNENLGWFLSQNVNGFWAKEF
jgi:hypothetical protein